MIVSPVRRLAHGPCPSQLKCHHRATVLTIATSQTTAAPPAQSSAAPSSAADTSTAVVVTSSSAAPSSTSTTSVAPSSAAPSSSSTTPTSSAAPTTTSTTPTSTAGQSTQIVTVTRSNQSAPGLITDASGIARTSTSATAAKETGSANKGGIGGSGLSVGAVSRIYCSAHLELDLTRSSWVSLSERSPFLRSSACSSLDP